MSPTAFRASYWILWTLLTLWLAAQIWPWIAPAPEAVPRAITPRGDLAADERATIELFEAARDSVVYISTRQNVRDYWTRNVFSVPAGTGSGFVWDQHGHVVTNWHVIEGASEALVRLSNGRDYRAALVGASPEHDIAVLRIGVGFEPPPPVPVGTSADLRVGQKVFAIGNPFGLDWTLTTGIVSALDRTLPNASGGIIDHLIQTDAAINPGNSGGPLLDSAGRLIGINTAIFSPSGASAGIGFAVPVDTVNRVVPQLIRHGRYLRPALGIRVHAGLNEKLSRRTGIAGVFVLGVEERSAAARAGLRGATLEADGSLRPGDVILAVADRKVGSLEELFAALDQHAIGERVPLRLWRQGTELELEVELEAAAD
ncbi:MAG: 2-alkenal reductase [Lysobacteraceae bacterium]|nr:MAG: 2-alkenal reductase [Xanthomonadaceae bacterium]